MVAFFKLTAVGTIFPLYRRGEEGVDTDYQTVNKMVFTTAGASKTKLHRESQPSGTVRGAADRTIM